MDANVSINFKVTPSQKETIALRAAENGFDDISAYLKVAALKTQAFNPTPAGTSMQEPDIELGFMVTEQQNKSIEEKVQESACKDLSTYLIYVSLHAVVSAVLEVRSTGNLSSMLERIAASKKQ